MITLLKVSTSSILYFIYITIFKMYKIKKLPEREKTLSARKELKQMADNLIKVAEIKLETVYVNKEEYQKLNSKDKIVIVANHESNVDIPVLMSALDIPIGFVAKKEMESWPFYSSWMKLSKCIFLNRANARDGIKDMKRAVEIIKDGYPTVIFPEGERTLSGEVGNFKKGSFKIATETNGIILPVTIDGTFNVQRRGNVRMNRCKNVKITIGNPIYLKDLNSDEMKNLSFDVREKIINQKNSI